MTAKELKNYLKKFPEEEEVRFIAIDLKGRIAWQNNQIDNICITDAPAPVIVLELNESKPFDEEMIQTAEEDERNMKTKLEPWAAHYTRRFERVK